jgi:ubiquitin
MGNDLVKQNINFMENPLWVLSENPQKELRITNDRGEFLISSGQKLPERTDINFLLYLLKVSQQSGYVQKIELTRHEILKECELNRSEINYKRLEESLNRWKFVGIKFKGTFYDNKEYLTKAFGIINEYSIDKETKKLKIEFSKSFLEMVKSTNYCKFIDFKKYIRLRRPVSSRLYEILLKTFVDRQEWEIEAMKLAEKLTLGESGKKKLYPADIKIKIEPAVNEINQKTELEIELETRRNNDKQLIFRFKLLKNMETEKHEQENNEIQTLIDLLKEDYRGNKSLNDILKRHYTKHGYDYVKYNILYANKKATKAYTGFLKTALSENWGEDLKLEQEKIARQEEIRQIELEKKRKIEEEARNRVNQAWQINMNIASFVNSLENKEKSRFINSVLEYLKDRVEFQIAVSALNSSPQIRPSDVAMFFEAFKNCYNSYIQLNNLDFQIVG